MIRNLLFFSLLFFALRAFSANTPQESNSSGNILEESELGKNLFTQSIKAAGSIGGFPEQQPSWNWNIGYKYQKATSATAGFPITEDITTSFSGGLGLMGNSGWGTSIALENSKTPAENLQSRGGTLTFSYDWKNGALNQSDPVASAAASNLSPALTTNLNLGSSNYIEQFNGAIARFRRRAVPSSGSAEIRQYLAGVSFEWQPDFAWEYEGGFDFYSYSRNVTDFQNALNSPLGLSRGLGSFGNTVGGFPKWQLNAGMAWNLAENWKTSLNESIASLAAGNQIASATKERVDYTFARNWKITAGIEYDTSIEFTAFLGSLAIAWGF